MVDALQDALAEQDGEDAEYDRLQDSLLQDFNFGGGLLQRKQPDLDADGNAPEDGPDQRRTKKEVGLICLDALGRTQRDMSMARTCPVRDGPE